MTMWRWIMRLFRRGRPQPEQDRILVDREGVAYPPIRPVALQAKRK